MPLSPLRNDLKLLPGPRLSDGSPAWTLHDPVCSRFFRIGRTEFEILARWRLGDADSIVSAVNRETTLQITPADVQALQHFFLVNSLLEPRGDAVLKHLKSVSNSRMTRQSRSFFKWLLLHYLFIRIPLLQPDRFLEATLPAARLLVSRPFLYFLGFIACLSFFLILRQWEAFLHTFLYFFSLKGLIFYALSLFVVKLVHELGHAYTAKAYGLKVPTMGLAFLVLWPLLYTDNSEAWKLTSRKARMNIVAAGTLAELGLAVLAAFLWIFLPDGPLRSACFLITTATCFRSFIINLNPFMRFDGYYLLSDFLDVPNLQTRAFALGKEFMRKILLGLNSPKTEAFSERKKNMLIVFAYLTWLYRLVLFTAIALMVYHLFFKALGMFLFAVEMFWFVLLPICREIYQWWENRREIGCNGHVMLTLTLAICLIVFLIVPTRTVSHVPAVLKCRSFSRIYPPFPARVKTVAVKNGQNVAAGELLFILESPLLEFKEKQAETQVRISEELLRRGFSRTDLLEQHQVIQQKLSEAMTEWQGCREQKAQLRITAPAQGRITDMPDSISAGVWVGKSQLLTVLADPGSQIIEGCMDETLLNHIHVGDAGLFYMENRDMPPVCCTVREIAPTGSRILASPYLASVYGGGIAAKMENRNTPVSPQSLYRVILTPDRQVLGNSEMFQIIRGSVRVAADRGGKSQSLLYRCWLHILAVLIRESSF
jgi:putative peptide zinc metalloprotease protein